LPANWTLARDQNLFRKFYLPKSFRAYKIIRQSLQISSPEPTNFVARAYKFCVQSLQISSPEHTNLVARAYKLGRQSLQIRSPEPANLVAKACKFGRQRLQIWPPWQGLHVRTFKFVSVFTHVNMIKHAYTCAMFSYIEVQVPPRRRSHKAHARSRI
jgi:hypothetical protein